MSSPFIEITTLSPFSDDISVIAIKPILSKMFCRICFASSAPLSLTIASTSASSPPIKPIIPAFPSVITLISTFSLSIPRTATAAFVASSTFLPFIFTDFMLFLQYFYITISSFSCYLQYTPAVPTQSCSKQPSISGVLPKMKY